MRTIFTYQLELVDKQIIVMPDKAEIISSQSKDGILCLWAIVETDNNPIRRTFFIVGTGHMLPNTELKHIQTIHDRGFVWHVFEEV